MSTRLSVRTAGLTLDLEDLTHRHTASLARATDTGTCVAIADPDVRVVVERRRHMFRTTGMAPVTRGVWSAADTMVIDSVGGSGFSQLWRCHQDHLEVRARWTPSWLEKGATVLGSRRDALRGQVLLHYPAMWWAVTRGYAPLHVSVLEIDGVVAVLAGPGGVGKSTLVAQALGRGARAACDNVAVCDGEVAHGLREPLRLAVADGGPASGARTTHGRRELSWDRRVPTLRPDLVLVVRRGDGPHVRAIDPQHARRALVAGTYAAGELRRFWALTALLGLATGHGPVLPPVDEVAQRLTSRLPCFELELGQTPGAGLHTLLAPHLANVGRQEVAQ
jgi:hypothetical protein